MMFKIKQKLDNIYDLLISFNNNERKHTTDIERLMKSYEKDNIEMAKELDARNLLLEERQAHYNQELSILREENKKLHEYLAKFAEILKDNQKQIIKKKPTKVDLMTEKMNKISDEAKAKLK